jgi:hypothetical protein
MDTIKCEVVADKVWFSAENRFLTAGEVVEFPKQVKNYTGDLVPFKVGDSFKVLAAKKQAGDKQVADLV